MAGDVVAIRDDVPATRDSHCGSTREARQHQAERSPRLSRLHHGPTGITCRSNTGRTRAPAHPARPVSGRPETGLISSPESDAAFSSVMVGALTLF